MLVSLRLLYSHALLIVNESSKSKKSVYISSGVYRNRGLLNVPVSSYVKRTPHETIYGHKKKVCPE